MGLMILIAALICIFSIRMAWIAHSVDLLVLNSFYWTLKTKQSSKVIGEITAFWPYFYMVMELWNWSFRRYVIHQDHFDAIKEFVREANGKEHLDFKEFLGPMPGRIELGDEVKDDSDSFPEQK
ncbi:MAG: hypothetical protein V4507_00330 [Verrucomicrobiota bacterium]